jgi:hypothetical protein
MPRYFFHLYNDYDVPDPEGEELPDDDAARERAIVGIRELMGAFLAEGQPLDLKHRIEVEGEQGKRLFTVLFSEAVMIRNFTPASGQADSRPTLKAGVNSVRTTG